MHLLRRKRTSSAFAHIIRNRGVAGMLSNTTTETQKRSLALSHTEIAAFCSQISMIMNSGISVAEGLSIMLNDTESPQEHDILKQIHEQVDAGNPLFIALKKTGCFPKYVLDMTEIGERTGRLDTVMASLASYYEREESISKSIRHAVSYPMIMVGMMLIVFIVLVVQVLPVFNQVFEQLGAEMTGLSRNMMHLGQLIGQYSFVLVGIVALIVIAFVVMRSTTTGKALFERLKHRMFRKISAKIASERFASSMSMMIKSGLDIEQSLEMAYKIVDNSLVREKIDICRKRLESGSNFSDAIVEADIFSGIHGRMVSIGFKTGTVDAVMDKLSVTYEEEIDTQISNAIAVLEPTLVAILSVVVGMILLSVMLPLMGIMSSIG